MANVLLIEDQESLLDTLSTLLALEGHHVYTALEKSEVQEILKNEAIELILLDIFLVSEEGEEINGMEILDEIRRNQALKDTAVIMTSGSDLEEQVIKAGADGFLMKPYMPDQLLSLIQSQLANTDPSLR